MSTYTDSVLETIMPEEIDIKHINVHGMTVNGVKLFIENKLVYKGLVTIYCNDMYLGAHNMCDCGTSQI